MPTMFSFTSEVCDRSEKNKMGGRGTFVDKVTFGIFHVILPKRGIIPDSRKTVSNHTPSGRDTRHCRSRAQRVAATQRRPTLPVTSPSHSAVDRVRTHAEPTFRTRCPDALVASANVLISSSKSAHSAPSFPSFPSGGGAS